MDRVELLGLMLGNLEHFHAQDIEAVLLELLDNVADCFLADSVGFDNGQSALKCFHFIVGR